MATKRKLSKVAGRKRAPEPVQQDKFDRLSEAGAKDVLRRLVEKLDEVDLDDALGTEGWRHFLDFEDEGV